MIDAVRQRSGEPNPGDIGIERDQHPLNQPPFGDAGIGSASTWVVWLLAAVVALILIAFAATAIRERSEAFSEAEQLATDTSRTLAEHAQRFIQVNDLVLKRAVDVMKAPGREDAADLRGRASRLAEIAADLPHASSDITAIWIFDEEGNGKLNSLNHPPETISALGRSWFHGQENGTGGLFISELLVSRRTGELAFTLSRRLAEPGDPFTGVAMVAVVPDDMTEFYRSIRLRYPATFELVSEHDLSILVRIPGLDREQMLAARRKQPYANAIASSSSGLLRAVSGVDNVDYITSYRRAGDLPLFVNVSIPIEAIEAAWLNTISSYGMFGLLAVAASISLGWIALRQTRKLHASHDSLEGRVAERTRALQCLLSEKELLVREIHHRVKNNLQVVMSLLTLEANRHSGSGYRRVFDDTLRRLRAMSLVHQMLYQSQRVDRVDISSYLKRLGEMLVEGHRTATEIRFQFEGPALFADLDTATPLGLIAAEVVTNAMEHAFANRREGAIRMSLNPGADRLLLRIVDDGIGIAPEHHDGFGLKMVRGSVRQLGGECNLTGGATGTAFQASFPTEDRDRRLFSYD